MQISPMKVALIHVDRRTNMKQIGVPVTRQTHITVSWDSRRGWRRSEGFGCELINGVIKESLFCYLPLEILQDICNCQLHVILSHFVQIV